MNVTDVMTPRSAVVTVSLPGGREDALEYLQGGSFSSVPVIKDTDEGEVFRGLVSREALIRQPDEDQLALLMDEDVPRIGSDATIATLCELIVAEDARRVPVVDDDELVGIVTITDVIRALANGEVRAEGTIRAVADRVVNATYVGTPLAIVEREIHYARVPYALVLDEDGDLAGVVTEVDIIDAARIVEGEASTGDSIASEDDEWMWEGIKAVGSRYLPTRNVELPNGPVREFMTEKVVTLTRRRTIQEAAQEMITHDVEQLPLMDGEELVGVVRDTNLLEAIDA